MFVCISLILIAFLAWFAGYGHFTILLLLLTVAERHWQLISLAKVISSFDLQSSFSLRGIRSPALQSLIQNFYLRLGNYLEAEDNHFKLKTCLNDSTVVQIMKESGARLIIQIEKQAEEIQVNDLFAMLTDDYESELIAIDLKAYFSQQGVRALSIDNDIISPLACRNVDLLYPFELRECSNLEVQCYLLVGFSAEQAPSLSQLIQVKNWVKNVDKNAAEGRRLARLKNKVIESRSSNIFKNKMIAGLSHDLRSPINNLRALLACLNKDLENCPPSLELISLADNNLLHLQELAENLLELAKFRAGKTEVKAEYFSLSDLIQEVVANYKMDAELRKLDLSLVLPPEPVNLLAARVQVKRILSNILSNALKYTEKGGITIGVRAGIDNVSMFIKDTGVGLKPEQIQTICEPFRRFTEKEISGLGLGLSVCKTLAQFNNGKINIKSEVGKGSEFSVIFSVPVSKQAPIAA